MCTKKIITSINKYKGNIYNVKIDDEDYYLHSLIKSEYYLKVGMELTQQELDKILFANNYRKAKERAFYLLDYRDHTYKELKDKLSRNYNADVVQAVMNKVTELGLINDERYAQNFARKLFEAKRAGRLKVKYEMLQKGIDKKIVERLLDLYEDDTVERLTGLIIKKYSKYLNDEKGLHKIYNALVRNGYSYTDIKAALKEINVEDEEKWQ